MVLAVVSLLRFPIRNGVAKAISALVAVLLTSGCVVGPDFQKPAAPDVAGYTPAPLAKTPATPNVAGGAAQTFNMGADIAGDWWTLFHSKPLSDLIDRSLANNHDLKAAQAALRVARESTLAQKGAYYPSITAGFGASRQSQPATLAPVPSNNAFVYDLFTPQVAVSYTPDIFGLNQRTVESLEAQEQAARFQMIATYTTLTSNVVVTAIQQAATQEQIAATREQVAADTKALEILRYQLKRGYASGIDVAAQETQLAQDAAALPPLIKQLAQLHDMQADLAGQFPSEPLADEFTLDSLHLPLDVPVSLPSALVAQRPDVRQAEENLHAASAAIGVAVANRLPNMQITANAGSEALVIGRLFAPGTGFWSVAAALTQPIFDGGQLLHQERGARAAYVQALEQYRSTTLAAFQNVADTLTALQQDAEALKTASAAANAAKVTLDLTQRQLKDGYVGTLALLEAEQAYQQAHIALVQAQASRYADTAALFQALGGGWWHRSDLTGLPEDKHDQ